MTTCDAALQVTATDFSTPMADDQWRDIEVIVENFRRYTGFLYTVLKKLADRGFQVRA